MTAARPIKADTKLDDAVEFKSDPEPSQFLADMPRFRRDRIAYIADMIAELEAMSQAAGCPTLANILRVAHAEAHQQLAKPASQLDPAILSD
jgi:hypothetical protein